MQRFAEALKENRTLTSVSLWSMFCAQSQTLGRVTCAHCHSEPSPQKGALIDTDLHVFRRKWPGTARDLECPDKGPCHGVTHRPNAHHPLPPIDALQLLWKR